MSEKRHDCGPYCDALNDLQHSFHLLMLLGDRPNWHCYRDSPHKGRTPKDKTCRVKAAEYMRPGQPVAMALAWHREQDRIRHAATRQGMIDNLVDLATVFPGDFFRIHEGKVEIFDTSHLAPSQLRAVRKIKEGAHGPEIVLHDPVPALRLLAEITGAKSPERVETLDTGPLIQEMEDAWVDGDEEAGEALEAAATQGQVLPAYRAWKKARVVREG